MQHPLRRGREGHHDRHEGDFTGGSVCHKGGGGIIKSEPRVGRKGSLEGNMLCSLQLVVVLLFLACVGAKRTLFNDGTVSGFFVYDDKEVLIVTLIPFNVVSFCFASLC